VALLYVTHSEHVAWEATGWATARREGVRLSGIGAISLLLGYFGFALICFAMTYSYWRRRIKSGDSAKAAADETDA
jgi:hypothetical protein